MAEGDLAVIVASVAVVITFVGVLLSNKRTQESNELLKKELNTKLRPWVYIYDFGPKTITLVNDAIVDYNVWKSKVHGYVFPPKNVRIAIKLKNSGPLPAINYRHYMDYGFNLLTKDDLNNPFSEFTRDLVPGEETEITFTISYDEFLRTENEFLNVACIIEYDIDEKLIGQSGLIGFIHGDIIVKSDTWVKDFPK